MIRVLPYKTPLYKITISGKTLIKALEHSAYLYDYNNCAIPEQNIYGGFIQMAGKTRLIIIKRNENIGFQHNYYGFFLYTVNCVQNEMHLKDRSSIQICLNECFVEISEIGKDVLKKNK